MTSLNINPQEIHTFDAAAQDWWNPQGAFKTLHDINPLRLAFIAKHVDLQQKKVVDVGCGGGILTESMAMCGADVMGIDMSPATLVLAQQHAESQDLVIQYSQTTVEELAEQYPQQFDVVTCMEMLEHVPDPGSVIAACARLTAPNGYVFFSTVNRNFKSYAFAVLGAEYIFKLLPRGLHHYDKFIRPAELANWARIAKLQVCDIAGMDYNPLTKHCRLSQDPSVNYLMCCKPL